MRPIDADALLENLKNLESSGGNPIYRKAVSKASRGKLTEDMLRDMSMGSVALPIAEWRLAAKALDKVEGRKNEGT